MCGKKFLTASDSSYTYAPDYSYINWQFKITPVDDTVKVTGTNVWCKPSTCSRRSGEIIKNDDGSYTVKIVVNILSKTETAQVNWTYDNITINGDKSWVNSVVGIGGFYRDHQAPVIENITQTDQQSLNGWATIKQIGISGIEESSEVIGLSIIDKQTGKKLVDGAVVSVNNQKWTYTCTPALEGSKIGHVYTVKVIDRLSNVVTKDFTVYKTDGKAPQVESPLSYTDWSNKAKTITLTFTDYGSGDVQVSLGDQTHYQVCTKTADGKYQITYTFSDDIIGNKNYDLYLKDGLGNATKVTLIVGNIDKNMYIITYNMDGGTASGLKTTYTVEDTFTLPQPTKTGYTFLGYVGSNGTTAQKSVTVNKCTRGNLTYTAQWQANNYYLTFNGNGGLLNIMDGSITKNNDGTGTAKVKYDVNYYYSLGILATRSGYVFKGFYDAPSDGIQVFKVDGNTRCLSVTSKYYNKDNIWKYAGDVTVYAQYRPITYTLKYDANGGSGTMSNQKCTYDVSQALMANTFKRDGYTFKGWNTKADGSGKAYSDKQSIKNIVDKDGTVVTLYAQWQINTYDLTVNHIVSGNMGNKHSDFSFTLNLSGMSDNNIIAVFTDASGKQTTKTLSMNNGKVAFSLKHGENVVFKSIPYNTSYTITENNADGYTVSNSNASGKVTANTTVTFTSTRNATVPTSADTNAKAMVAIAGLSVIVAIMLILKRRKTKTE